jgi:DNA-directed RNA polymerase sigma subunit (sigma70/sigma32)
MALRQKSLPKLSAPKPVEPTRESSAKRPRKSRKPATQKATVTVVSSDPNLKAILEDSCRSQITVHTSNSEAAASRKVEEAKQSLGSLESEVISALFPASGMPESFEEVAARLGMSPVEVKEIADNALRGLRGPARTPRNSSAWN